ncbi:hypothetical protein TVAG_261100 [Trichomonas vaginalis G3]|uniref:Uncharacterized protein n=1 Tax=Trichomonas vaginalis (strain ATCC PRA-98 / G3) TaxID=412133 RepID=A2FPS0_TRIV3|nr:hypothetical protein TVAGG3_0494520 [Trichomonas vaginalis G3]EAX93100.1 hypothetical protein TVAG_261100 [Trichomonas vaginalis G3]KAI5516617.1 hypothetical protein TVAGG3_0494520 [Trichomonas vaginalis G3]|eukprot:XP_001306030.1 hypothetical protein [Trichomonas vaginalis G3]
MSTGSKWGAKSNTGTSTGASWGSKASSVATTGTKTFGSTTTSVANQQKSVSGTQWNPNFNPATLKDVDLVSTIDIPYAKSHYRDESNPNSPITYEINHISHFGMFNHLNIETLRYNDYIMKGGIKAHDWDKTVQQQTTTTTSSFGTTSTTGFGAKTTGFGSSTSSQPLATSPWLYQPIPQKFDVTNVEADVDKPYGEIETTKIVISKVQEGSVSSCARLKKFTPRGITKAKTIHDNAIKPNNGESKTPNMYTFTFKNPKDADVANAGTNHTTMTSVSSSRFQQKYIDKIGNFIESNIGQDEKTVVYYKKDMILTIPRVSVDFDSKTVSSIGHSFTYEGSAKFKDVEFIITAKEDKSNIFNSSKLEIVENSQGKIARGTLALILKNQ